MPHLCGGGLAGASAFYYLWPLFSRLDAFGEPAGGFVEG